MIVDLKRFFLGQSDTMEYALDLSGVELGGVKPFCAPVRVKASFKGNAGSVLLDTELLYTTVMPCDRCGEVTSREWNRRFSHVLVSELNEDLDELLREDILLDLPSKYLCSPDCKGLCPKCGKNLNEGDCGCDRKEIDPRLEVLKSLL